MCTRILDYTEARAEAQAEADRVRAPIMLRRVVEFGVAGFNLSRAPRAENRYGFEARAEIVEPSPRGPR